MKLTIELDREVDGRWIAEVPELNALLLYGDSKQDAIQRAQSAAREIVLDRIALRDAVSRPVAGPRSAAMLNASLQGIRKLAGESIAGIRAGTGRAGLSNRE